MNLDIEQLTNADLGTIQRLLNVPMSELYIKGEPTWDFLTAATYVILKKTQPEITWDEVRNGNLDIVLGAEPDPKDL